MANRTFAQQLSAGELPQIICAVCNKPADMVQTYHDYMRCVRVIRVECHGATEDVELSDMMLVEVNSIHIGKAFSKQAEEEIKQRLLTEHELDQHAAVIESVRRNG